ncbi:MAG TPA: serine hydrolase domain-containing protein [Bacteroidia bacterium]|nr:serine hydrolase domain-containing protein [Bacteroidia bacterium]
MKAFYLYFILLVSYTSIAQTYSPEVEAKIKQVENNLFRYFKIEGQANETIKQRMALYKIVGLSIAVVNDYKIEWAKGYGWADSAEKRPVTPETVFEPGSISKSLNSVGILKLAQNKQIDLYTDINNYLTSWKFPYDTTSKGKKITMANLLSHTAGLTVHGFLGYEVGDTIPTLQQILDGKRPANSEAVRSEIEPGIKHMYSGGGTTISQLILTDITKQPYDKWMFENVLKPIGMTNSSFSQPQPKEKQKLMATGYLKDRVVKGKYHVYPEQAAAGLWTTPTDLAKFIIETQQSLKGKSNKVLTQQTTQLQLRPYIDSAVGLGVFTDNRNGVKYFSHGAGNAGFSGYYTGSYEGGNGIVIVCNATDVIGLRNELMNSVATAYQWKGLEVTEGVTKKEVKLSEAKADKFIGCYQTGTNINEIYKKGNAYYLQAAANAWQIHFTSDSSFINLESISEKTFLFNKEGKVVGLRRVVLNRAGDSAKKVEVLKLSKIDLQRFVGDYKIDEKFIGDYALDEITNSVIINDGVPFLAVNKNTKCKMKFISKNEFFMTEDPGTLYTFQIDSDGKVLGFTGNDGERLVTLKKK